MRARLVAIPVALVLAACSDERQPTSTDETAAKVTACSTDTRKDVYEPGLSKIAGALSVILVEATPAPPVKGTNALTLEVHDAAGQPVDGAAVTLTPWMPDHAHGSAVKPSVTALGAGRYVVDKVYLPMAGLWQLKVAVQPEGGGPLQEAMFQFCLDG